MLSKIKRDELKKIWFELNHILEKAKKNIQQVLMIVFQILLK